jgi:predicted kinase
MNKTLQICVGLPRSGKSTWAKKQKIPIVNPDSIRMVLHGTPFRQEAEPLVWSIAKIMVASLFEAGHKEVILDATNINKFRRKEWEDVRWANQYYIFNTCRDECLRRAEYNSQDYLFPVIDSMASRLELPKEGVKEQFPCPCPLCNKKV